MSWHTARFLSWIIVSPLYLIQLLRMMMVFYFTNALFEGTTTLATNIATVLVVFVSPISIVILELGGRAITRHTCDGSTHSREMMWRADACRAYTHAVHSSEITSEKLLFGAVLLSMFTGVIAGFYANSTIGMGRYDLIAIGAFALEFILHVSYVTKHWSTMISNAKT